MCAAAEHASCRPGRPHTYWPPIRVQERFRSLPAARKWQALIATSKAPPAHVHGFARPTCFARPAGGPGAQMAKWRDAQEHQMGRVGGSRHGYGQGGYLAGRGHLKGALIAP